MLRPARLRPTRPSARPRLFPSLALVILLVALAVTAAACSEEAGPITDGNVAGPTETVVAAGAEDEPSGEADTEPPVDRVAQVMATMTAEQKIGQLLMPMVFGTGDDVTPAERRLNLEAHGYATPSEIVARYQLGGVIYLQSNIDSAPQVKSFSRRLQQAAADSSGIGLLVAIDQEGGRVSRLSDEVSLFPPALDLAGDPRLIQESAYVTGQQVQQQGINVVLAPVADVVEAASPSFIGNRSYGEDPEAVATMVSAAVTGLQQSGVAAAVKHWPGHGATSVDSHSSLPTLDVDRETWEGRERVPFAAAVEQDVSIVLVGHLAMPKFDPSAQPATISPILVDDLLRNGLGFDGVVMSDALNMGAVGDIPNGELEVGSILAGVDIVLIPPSLSDAYAALTAAVADGRISEQRLDASVARVLRLKENLGLLPIR